MASHTATLEAANRRFAEIFADLDRMKAGHAVTKTKQPAGKVSIPVEAVIPSRGAGVLERDPSLLRRALVRTA